jgi:hypothetical protein
MYYPELANRARSVLTTETFLGYDHNLKTGDGEWYDTTNLSSRAYPLMAQREKRGAVRTIANPGGILGRDALLWIEDGVLCYNLLSMAAYMPGITLSAGKKTLVSMGAYVCIFPDKVYFNTADFSDNGYMERTNAIDAAAANVKYSICKLDGTAVTVRYTQGTVPASPANGDYWLDTSSAAHVLKVWSASSNMWSQVATVYCKLEAAGIGTGLKKYDGIVLTGCAGTEQVKALNAAHVLYDAGDNYLVVIGLLDASYTQAAGTVTAARTVPDMDFVTECGNRLWGCKYGVVGGKTVNELYCCKLGDFKNWACYMGISTDAWAASVGSDGVWTGAATMAGSPVFFKENSIHRVYPSATGAHQVVELQGRGVQKGSGASLAVVGEVLYYKARDGVCAYDGSLPVLVSAALGENRYYEAAGAGCSGLYYVSMRRADGEWSLFVYDVQRGIWMREDSLHAAAFARIDDELYCLDADGTLWALRGTVGTAEEDVTWACETGLMGYDVVEKKYVSRFNLRMQLPEGSSADLWLQYDSSGVWRHAGHLEGRGTGTFLLPVRPARCDHFRFRLTGRGEIRLYSLARILERGSDA